MRAILFESPKNLTVGESPDPVLLDARDALLRVRVSAVCGSDLHVYHGRETGLDRGTVMGHEVVGEVVAVGDSVRRFRAGDRVVVPFTTSCGQCWPCREGLTARCTQGQLFGWVQEGRGLQGTQAERLRVPLADTTLVRVPEGLDDGLALLAGDVLSTACFGATSAGVQEGSTVAVVGCGPVGLLAVWMSRQLRAREVLAIDGVAYRRDFAARLGAAVVEPGEAVSVARRVTEGRGVDCVLEMVGSPGATRLAYELVRVGGSIAAAGVHTESHFAFSPGEAYDKNLTYRAGRCPARHHAPAMLDLLSRHGQELVPLLTHRFPLDVGADAYRLFDEKRDGCVKVLLTP